MIMEQARQFAASNISGSVRLLMYQFIYNSNSMSTWNIFKQYELYKLRKHYVKLRKDAVEAERVGDRKKFVALNAIADRMMDSVISF